MPIFRNWTMTSETHTLEADYPRLTVRNNLTGQLEAFSSARADFDSSALEFVQDFFPTRVAPERDSYYDTV